MFKPTVLLFILQLLVYNAKGQQLFQKTYNSDTSFVNYAKDDIATILPFGSGYLLAGSTQGYPGINAAGLVMQVDNNGTVQQSWSYKHGYITRFKGIAPASNGNFIVVGTDSYCDSSYCPTAMVVAKLNPQGQQVWGLEFNGGSRDYGYSICPAANTNFIVSGWYYNVVNHSSYDILVAKITNAGDTLWARAYGTTNSETTYDAAETPTGHVVATAKQNGNILLLKLKPDGSLAWCKNYGRGSAKRVIPMADGYLIAGDKSDGGVFEITSPFILKVDTNGSPIFYKSFYGADYDYLSDIQITADGGCILAGTTSSFAYDVTDLYLIKCAADGNVEWARAYGGYEYDEGISVHQNTDGTYVASGYTASFNNSNGLRYAAWLLQTDSVGSTGGCRDHEANPILIDNTITPTTINVVPSGRLSVAVANIQPTTYSINTQTICPHVNGIAEDKAEDGLLIYPNPASGIVTIQSTHPIGKVRLTLFNTLGQVVYTENMGMLYPTKQLDVSALPSGLYTLSLQTDKGNLANRLVVNH